MRDISVEGAQLLVSTVAGIPSEFRLELGEDSARSCFVRWRLSNALGVVFLTPQEAALGQ
jgi:hypothetical protein